MVHTNTTNQFSSAQLPPPRDAVTIGINDKSVKTVTNVYDAENHLATFDVTVAGTRTNASTNQVTNSFSDHGVSRLGWGPNNHPLLYQSGSGSPALTLHWDGDMILFVTDSAGAVVDFKVGLDGFAAPTSTIFAGLNAYDRDPAGVVIASNNATGSSGMQPTDPSLPAANTAASPNFKSVYSYFPYMRSDGFQIPTGVFGVPPVQINGVRAFNSALGAWTTPDAFEGDVHDPASQQRYMFNRGNAYDYEDPSGYQSFPDFFEPHLMDRLVSPLRVKNNFPKSGFANAKLAKQHWEKHVLDKQEFAFANQGEYVCDAAPVIRAT